jgi:septal ring factor EnvC (AmiA/AmiB activator)
LFLEYRAIVSQSAPEQLAKAYGWPLHEIEQREQFLAEFLRLAYESDAMAGLEAKVHPNALTRETLLTQLFEQMEHFNIPVLDPSEQEQEDLLIAMMARHHAARRHFGILSKKTTKSQS